MADSTQASRRDRHLALAVLTGAYFFSGFAALSFAPLLPILEGDLGLPKSILGLFVSLVYLGAVMSGFPCGWLADRWGVPRTLATGLVLQGAALGAVASVPPNRWAILLMVLSGLGYGAVNPSTSKGIIHWFTPRQRGTAMAVKQTGFTAGAMAAAGLLPAVADAVGWRWAVGLTALSVAAAGLLTVPLYPRPGSAARTAAPQVPAGRAGPPAPSANRKVLFWSVICIFYAAVQMSGTAYLTMYLVERFSLGVVAAGLLLSVTQGAGAVGRILWGRLSDLFFTEKRHREIIALGFLAAAACFAFALLSGDTGLWVIGVVATVFGLAAVGYNALVLTYLGELAGPDSAGRAIGLAVTIAYFGVVLGPPGFGWTVDNFGYSWAWAALGSMLVLAKLAAIVFVWTDGRRPLRQGADGRLSV